MRSDYTPTRGFDLDHNNPGMTYMYGLSDFWSVMFKDSAQIEHLLQCTTFQLSDIYSRFLQKCSAISLADVQVSTHQQVKLLVLSEKDRYSGNFPYMYKIPEEFLSARNISNRPLLPTVSLKNDVHFTLDTDTGTLQLHKKLSEIGFPSRTLVDGNVEYSLWVTDVEIDEQMVYENYGKLLQVEPEVSTDRFKSFIEGLFYVYTHGPVINAMLHGFNVSIGIPLSRGDERVIAITKYLGSDNWLIITDRNSYVIPYGLAPTVSVGDELEAGDQMSSWVKVKDYEKDGDWWINLNIPDKFIPELPEGAKTRFATEGSYADYVMRNYLKSHTFLVDIQVTYFQSTQVFGQISSLMENVKPAYTCPIYIWSTTVLDDVDVEDDMQMQWNFPQDETLMLDIRQFRRNNEYKPYDRNQAYFFRYQVPPDVDKWVGRGEVYEPSPFSFPDGTETDGVIGQPHNRYFNQPVYLNGSVDGSNPKSGFENGSLSNTEFKNGFLSLQTGKSSGTWTSAPISLASISAYANSRLSVTLGQAADKPGVTLQVALNGGSWTTMQTRQEIPVFQKGSDYHNRTLQVRITLTRGGAYPNPSVSSLATYVQPEEGVSTGYSDTESAWFNTLHNRRYVASSATRGQVSFERNRENHSAGQAVSIPKKPYVSVYRSGAINTVPVDGGTSTQIFYDTSTVPLYVTNTVDIIDKLVTLGYKPDLYDRFVLQDVGMRVNYETLFFRSIKGIPRNVGLPKSLVDYDFAPKREDVSEDDAIFVSKIYSDTYAVLWGTTKGSAEYQPYSIGPSPDGVTLEVERKLTDSDLFQEELYGQRRITIPYADFVEVDKERGVVKTRTHA